MAAKRFQTKLHIAVATIKTEVQYENTKKGDLGKISIHKWCECVTRVTGLNLPWRALANRLVTLADDGTNVLYLETSPVLSCGKNFGKPEKVTNNQVTFEQTV